MKRSALILGLFALLFALCGGALAEEFPVTNAVELIAALDSADSNGEDDTITLAPGTYGIIQGGAFTYEASGDQGNLILTVSDGEAVLDGGGAGQVLCVSSDVMADITLEGLAIVSGDHDGYGGGALISISAGNIVLNGCRFEENTAVEHGGGLFISNRDKGSLRVTDCRFIGNRSLKQAGGGLIARANGAMVDGSPFDVLIQNCLFQNNIASTGAGGALFWGGNLIVEGSVLLNNRCLAGVAGGLYAESYFGDMVLRDNLIANNSSAVYAGGAFLWPQWSMRYVDIVNNTITGNVVSGDVTIGGGLCLFCDGDNVVCSLANNIIRGNEAGGVSDDIYIYDDGNINYYTLDCNNYAVLSTDFTGGSVLDEPFSMDVDPLFVSSTDFHLQADSPLIDMGDSEAPSIGEMDLDGRVRIHGDAVDMGAYEYGSSMAGDGDEDDGDDDGSGSSGGCSVGSFAPALLLLVAPLSLLLRKR